MKSRFFRNLAKGLVVVSAALAVVNCDESTVAAAQQQYDPNDPLAALSSSGMADPAQVGDVDPTLASSSSTDIIGGGEVAWPPPRRLPTTPPRTRARSCVALR